MLRSFGARQIRYAIGHRSGLSKTLGNSRGYLSGNDPPEKEIILDNVIFFGRTTEDYLKMFDFKSLDDLKGMTVLDCPGGPALFTADANKAGINCTALDPMYKNKPDELHEQAVDSLTSALERFKHTAKFAKYTATFASESEFERIHLEMIQKFIDDFKVGRPLGRYQDISLPYLPFPANHFDYVLSGTLLFVYAPVAHKGLLKSDTFNEEWHRQSIQNMIRVAKKEVRIFPAITMDQTPSKHPYALKLTEEIEESELGDVSWYKSTYDMTLGKDVYGIRIKKKPSSVPDAPDDVQ